MRGERLSITVSDAMLKKVKETAEKNEMSLSQVVKWALREFYKEGNNG